MEDVQGKIISALAGIIVFVMFTQFLSCFVVSVNGQSEIAFTAADTFEIPSNNSSIRFAINGTYKRASLENNVWAFENLYFPNPLGTEKLDLKVSATDCDVTINPYRIFNYTSRGEGVRWVILSYTVLGHGTQVFDLGLDPDRGQLDVILNGEFVGRNHGWTRSADGVVTVTGATANVTIWYYGYPDSLKGDATFDNHYVVIGSTCYLAITVVLAAYITRRRKSVE